MGRILKSAKPMITGRFKKNIHQGIDLVGEDYTLDTVTAHSDGKVVWIQTNKKHNLNGKGNEIYGNAVKIKHDNGYYTLYAHLKNVYVKVGQIVKQGDSLGFMGNSGKSYGTHLHFEVRTKESPSSCIDPTPYLSNNLPKIISDHNEENM